MTRLLAWARYVRKLLVLLAGLLVQLVAFGVLHGQALAIAQALIGLATAAGLYRVPNGPRPVTPQP